MNILTDYVPYEVEVKGVRYPINWDFRTSILFEQLMFDEDVEDKNIKALELYYGYEIDTIRYINKDNVNEFIEQMLWFYHCAKDKTKENTEENSKEDDKEENKKIYDFFFDDTYIFSAFLQLYNIDLQEIENLHWWKFKALFSSLTDECKFVKILEYRSAKLKSIKDKEQRKFYEKMQKLYALPLTKGELDEIERDKKITQMLLNGEDPREFL